MDDKEVEWRKGLILGIARALMGTEVTLSVEPDLVGKISVDIQEILGAIPFPDTLDIYIEKDEGASN